MQFFDPNQTQSLPSWAPNQRPPSNNDSELPPTAMQADYAAWHSSLARWKEDAATWQAEHDALLKRLADLQRSVVEHGKSLNAHEATFGGIELSLAELERLGAISPERGQSGPADPTEHQHRDLLARVRQVDDAHQRMARHHAEVAARVADLERATSSPL
jgi:hypothetical protein